MSEPTRRERARADTDREIRQRARALLINEGPNAVTLRAIARQLGITAPALYRYYTSRDDLLHHVRMDICADLAAELAADLAGLSDADHIAQVLAICRGFRKWAVTHPQEFTLVFATPVPQRAPQSGLNPDFELATDPFGRIFLTVAGRVLANGKLPSPPDDSVPEQLRADLAAFRSTLLATIAEAGFELPEDVLSLGRAYLMLQFWVRLYGQVALEVFGNIPFAVTRPDSLFEIMLADLVADIGLVDPV